MSNETITLSFHEATTEQLEQAFSEAVASARKCEEQGSYLHTWDTRAERIAAVLDARRRADR